MIYCDKDGDKDKIWSPAGKMMSAHSLNWYNWYKRDPKKNIDEVEAVSPINRPLIENLMLDNTNGECVTEWGLINCFRDYRCLVCQKLHKWSDEE